MFYFIILNTECLKSKRLFVLKFPLIHLKSKIALRNFLNLEGFVQCETLFDSAKPLANDKTGFQRVLIPLALMRNEFSI